MGKEIPYLKKAETLDNYRLHLLFEDGIDGIVDLEKWKGKGVFSLWNDEKKFKEFIITGDKKLQWTDEIDMDPDSFYLQIINKSFEEYARD